MFIQNLALEGGGVWGVAYAGAFKALEEQAVLAKVSRIAGTSAGSIAALLVALRYTPDEIKTKLWALDFSKFKDRDNIIRSFENYGIYKGNFALDMIKGFISDKLGNQDATFKDLALAGGRDLRVFATNLSRQHVQEFSLASSPDMSIALAVRASMSIPVFFEAVNINNEIFVDGGVTFAYPILSFDDKELSRTLGFGFDHANATKHTSASPDAFGADHPLKYAIALIHSMMAQQSATWLVNKEVHSQTVMIDTGSVRPTEFTLSEAEKQMLFDNGYSATKAFFASS